MANSQNTTAIEDVTDPTIMAAFDAAEASYGQYVSEDISYTAADEALVTSGWTEIKNIASSVVANDHFQGVAYYKTVNGQTEIIIGDRGSQTLPDFVPSDAQLAMGFTPKVDRDALTYFQDVTNWAASNVQGTISIIETGHSLGGQEADYVQVNAASGTAYNLETVTFNAPGLGDEVPLVAGATYDALNISAYNDLVHIGGSILNQGYAGTSVTIPAGTSLIPAAVALATGIFSADPILAWASAGTLLYQGFVSNHAMGTMRAFFDAYPALADLNLSTYKPDQITQPIATTLSSESAAAWAAMSPDQKVAYFTSLISATGGIATSNGGTSGLQTPPSISETFSMSTNSSGSTVLTGSTGDVVTLSTSGNTLTLTDAAGDQESETATGSGATQVSWTAKDGAGDTGSIIYAEDGSDNGKITFANGSFATTKGDAAGNVLIDYYNASGLLVHTGWEYSDGSSGEYESYSLGNDVESVGTGVPSVSSQTLTNPDGSYQITTIDADDVTTTTNYDKSGNLLSTIATPSGALSNSTDATSTQATGIGVDTYDAVTNKLIQVTYKNTDVAAGTWVSGILNLSRSGVQSGTVKRSDGTSLLAPTEI